MSAPQQRAAAAAGLAAFALTFGAAPGAAQQDIQDILGRVVAVEKRAEFSLHGKPLRPLRARLPLVRGMRVVTFVDSDALMAYDHPRAMLFLGPKTEFVMRPPSAALGYRCQDPELVERLADLELEQGELRLVRERALSGCPLRVLTQVAVIVIVSTNLRVWVDPADGTTVVSVAEGAVEVYRRDPETGEPTGEPVRLEAGDVSVVAPGRAPSLPAPEDPGISLQSPATQAEPLPDPLGAPIPPGAIDVVGFCETFGFDLGICVFDAPGDECPPGDPPVAGQRD